MTTALTATCPTCGSTQGKVCRDGGTPTTPHPARRDALSALRAGASVFMLIRNVGQYRRGTLVTGLQTRAGAPGVTVTGIHGSSAPASGTVRASSVVWVGWADEFDPDLFNTDEALEAFPA